MYTDARNYSGITMFQVTYYVVRCYDIDFTYQKLRKRHGAENASDNAIHLYRLWCMSGSLSSIPSSLFNCFSQV